MMLRLGLGESDVDKVEKDYQNLVASKNAFTPII
jgi:hypothetical protein